MNEKIDRMQTAEPVRSDALAAFKRQVQEWGLTMPPCEPLVLDFGLGDFYHTGLIEYWVCNEFEAGYCGKILFVFNGQTCPMHSHRQKHETFFVMKGSIRCLTDKGEITLAKGAVLPVPQGMKHSFSGIGNALMLELSRPCDVNDNTFENHQVMEWLKAL